MFLDLFFPNRCLNCNEIIPGNDVICEKCLDQIDFIHWEQTFEDNPLKQRLKALFPVENVDALMSFEPKALSRKIIHALKYGGREKIGAVIAEWCTDRIELERNLDRLVTVPLHPRKLKLRGYNQLHLFADLLAKKIGVPHDPVFLKRITHNKAQAGTSLEEREKSKVKFKLSHQTKGQNILLIDDVCTSGNTLASCAWPIINAGNKVSVLVMAVDN